MNKETLFTMKSPYREDFKIEGYYFGSGEKSCCIVGSIRGNEVQQLYVCSQIIRILTELERLGKIVDNHKILVVPSANPYSMNISKRFWAQDNTDINRMFPGYNLGETTQRIADGLFNSVQGYMYGIQFASFYIPGDFIPHVRMMNTPFQTPDLANAFGLPYIVIRNPKPVDTTTLNYNWQLWNTKAFSVYTNETEHIDEVSAKEAISAILRFLSNMGIIEYRCHNGYATNTVMEDSLLPIKTSCAGIYKRINQPCDEIKKGDVMAEIIHPYEGVTIEKIIAPCDGIVFFAHKSPLVMQNSVVYKVIPYSHY
ncbi:MAG: M14 family metallopeptidase [Ruminococcus sp.]|nr:M14 family metallopeptidase [Ruminococcus sp.]MCD7800119.1 M14 family metallopeptidase [Ruminococcus sp.]